jgi:hypothetical protein
VFWKWVTNAPISPAVYPSATAACSTAWAASSWLDPELVIAMPSKTAASVLLRPMSFQILIRLDDQIWPSVWTWLTSPPG